MVDFKKVNLEIELKGVDSPFFKKNNYYNSRNLSKQNLLEIFFGQKCESKYNSIIEVISKEKDIDEKTSSDIIFWMFVSKMRSPYHRENIKDQIIWFLENRRKLIMPNEIISKESENSYVNEISREIHLSSFIDEKQFNKLYETYVFSLLFKDWCILKSTDDFQFLTNDNPGFSIVTRKIINGSLRYSKTLIMEESSLIYFVLTPKYCLEFRPYESNPPSIFDKKVRYEDASIEKINLINYGVFETKFTALISNSKEQLNQYIKR